MTYHRLILGLAMIILIAQVALVALFKKNPMITEWNQLKENNMQPLMSACVYIRDNMIKELPDINAARAIIEPALNMKLEVFLEILYLYNSI